MEKGQSCQEISLFADRSGSGPLDPSHSMHPLATGSQVSRQSARLAGAGSPPPAPALFRYGVGQAPAESYSIKRITGEPPVHWLTR